MSPLESIDQNSLQSSPCLNASTRSFKNSIQENKHDSFDPVLQTRSSPPSRFPFNDSVRNFKYDPDARVIGEAEMNRALASAGLAPDFKNAELDSSIGESTRENNISDKAAPFPFPSPQPADEQTLSGPPDEFVSNPAQGSLQKQTPVELKSLMMSLRSRPLSVGTEDYDDFFDMPDGLSTVEGSQDGEDENFLQSFSSDSPKEYLCDDASSIYSLVPTPPPRNRPIQKEDCVAMAMAERKVCESIASSPPSSIPEPSLDMASTADPPSPSVKEPEPLFSSKPCSGPRPDAPSSSPPLADLSSETHKSLESGIQTQKTVSSLSLAAATAFSSGSVICYQAGGNASQLPATGYLCDLVKLPIERGQFRILGGSDEVDAQNEKKPPGSSTSSTSFDNVPGLPGEGSCEASQCPSSGRDLTHSPGVATAKPASDGYLDGCRALRFIRSYTNMRKLGIHAHRPENFATQSSTRLSDSLGKRAGATASLAGLQAQKSGGGAYGNEGVNWSKKDEICGNRMISSREHVLDFKNYGAVDTASTLDFGQLEQQQQQQHQKTRIWPWLSLRRQQGEKAKMGKRRSLARLFGQVQA